MEEIKKLVLEEKSKGNIVVSGFEGLSRINLKEVILQPTTGLLYDLNRGFETILLFIEDPKWINDYASSLVITALKDRISELEEQLKTNK